MVDDFFGRAVPELRSRIKVNLRTQNIDVFEYGPGTDYQALMYLKSRFMAAGQEGYEHQGAFDRWLIGLGCFDFSPQVQIIWSGICSSSSRICTVGVELAIFSLPICYMYNLWLKIIVF